MFEQQLLVPEIKQGIKTQSGNALVDYVRTECFEHNSNFIGIWTGACGSGKSVSALRVCEIIDPTFSIDRVCFDIEALMQLIVKFQEEKESGLDIRGRCILYDEAGISMDNRAWQNQIHKILNDTIETFRFLNLVLMVTVPARNRIDKKMRDLFHGSFVITEKHTDYRRVKFYLEKINPVNNFEYRKYLNTRISGWNVRINSLKVYKPSAMLLHQYEKKMTEYKQKINVRGLKQLSNDVDRKDKICSVRELSPRQSQVMEFLGQGMSKKDIAKRLGISYGSVGVAFRGAKLKMLEVNEE